MKSARLLSMLLLLQAHQRMTTAQLAEHLEVSRRTVLRDVEALSEAGVPVYAERGRHGAVVLLSQSRLNVAHLDPAERELLLVAGLDAQALEQLGLHDTARAAARKLAAKATPGAQGTRSLTDVIVVDNAPWMAGDTSTGISQLVEVLLLGVRMRISYRSSGQERARRRVVDPYGLAVKGGRWYLVADHRGLPRLYAISRLGGCTALPEPAHHRPGATLESVWQLLRARTEKPGRFIIEARLRSNRVDLARRILGTRLVHTVDGHDGWTDITLGYTQLEDVRQLLQFGDHIQVIHPPEARTRIRELASALTTAHT